MADYGNAAGMLNALLQGPLAYMQTKRKLEEDDFLKTLKKAKDAQDKAKADAESALAQFKAQTTAHTEAAKPILQLFNAGLRGDNTDMVNAALANMDTSNLDPTLANIVNGFKPSISPNFDPNTPPINPFVAAVSGYSNPTRTPAQYQFQAKQPSTTVHDKNFREAIQIYNSSPDSKDSLKNWAGNDADKLSILQNLPDESWKSRDNKTRQHNINFSEAWKMYTNSPDSSASLAKWAGDNQDKLDIIASFPKVSWKQFNQQYKSIQDNMNLAIKLLKEKRYEEAWNANEQAAKGKYQFDLAKAGLPPEIADTYFSFRFNPDDIRSYITDAQGGLSTPFVQQQGNPVKITEAGYDGSLPSVGNYGSPSGSLGVQPMPVQIGSYGNSGINDLSSNSSFNAYAQAQRDRAAKAKHEQNLKLQNQEINMIKGLLSSGKLSQDDAKSQWQSAFPDAKYPSALSGIKPPKTETMTPEMKTAAIAYGFNSNSIKFYPQAVLRALGGVKTEILKGDDLKRRVSTINKNADKRARKQHSTIGGHYNDALGLLQALKSEGISKTSADATVKRKYGHSFPKAMKAAGY